jgi:hypothetical protein
MFKRSLWSVVAVLAVAGVAGVAMGAEPKDDVQAAVKKLADGGNYSWVTATDAQFVFGATDGKTDKETTTYTVAQFQGTNPVVVQGTKLVVKMEDGTWKSGAEIAKSVADATAAAATQPAGDAGGGGGPMMSPDSLLNMSLQGLRLPTVDMQDALDKLKELKKAETVYTADLSAEVATDLLVNRRPGTKPATAPAGAATYADPTGAKGSVKFTLKDGAVVKYEVHLSGNFSFGGQDMPIDRTNTTEFKDVGTTKITVPAEAKAKLTAATAPATKAATASAPARP